MKAIVCRVTDDTPPKIHNLVRLSELAHIEPSQVQRETLAKMNAFCVEGRYSDMLQPPPTSSEVRAYVSQAEEVLQWLNSR